MDRTAKGIVAIIAFVVCVSDSLSAAGQKSPLVVPLAFKPQETAVNAGVPVQGAMLSRSVEIRIEDGRVGISPARIGEGPDGDTPFEIRAGGDVLGFIKRTIEDLAGSRGVRIATPADRQLRVRLTRFWVKETHRTVGSVYAAQAMFAYVLTDSGGSQVYDGTGTGSANRYGRARSSDNCMEVLSDALNEAILDVFADPNLQAAWARGTGAAAPAVSAAATPASDPKPVELKIGMTEAEAIATLGPTVRRITLADRTLLQYADLVLTMVNSKVTDIQVVLGGGQATDSTARSPVVSGPPKLPGGLYVTGFGPGLYAEQVYLELTGVLSRGGIRIIEHRQVETGGQLASVAGVITAAREALADGVLYFTLSTGYNQTDRLRVQCYAGDGRLLWEDETTSRFQDTVQAAVDAVTKRMKEKLQERIKNRQLPGQGKDR